MTLQTPTSKPSRLAVESLATTSLTLTPRMRDNSPRRIAKRTSSIRNFGFNGAILSDENGEIMAVAGHARRQHVPGKTALLSADGRAFHQVQSVNGDLRQEG